MTLSPAPRESGSVIGRIPRLQRMLLVAVVACGVGGAGVALADPQNSGNPSVTLDISPNNGTTLLDSQSITVTGAGFQSGAGTSGVLRQTATLADGTAEGLNATPWFSGPSGTFQQTMNVTRTFQATSASNVPVTVDCAVVQCYVEAESNNGLLHSRHTISFATGSTSTSTTTPVGTSTSTSTPIGTSTSTSTPVSTSTSTSTSAPTSTSTTVALSECQRLRLARAQFNAQIDANQAAIRSAGLSPSATAAAVARLEAVRAQGNAGFDSAIAAKCAPSA